MATYLLTWNPSRFDWQSLHEQIEEIHTHGYSEGRWSCGNTQRIEDGDHVFLMRLGEEPRGIVGSGIARDSPYEAEHWDTESVARTALYVAVEFDVLIDAEAHPGFILDWQTLRVELPQGHDWTPQRSGVTIPDDVARRLEDMWAARTTGPITSPPNLAPSAAVDDPETPTLSEHDDREWVMRSIRQRRGQQAFRRRLLEAFQERCAISGCAIVDILEAAHIVPYRGRTDHRVGNGLLLRSDIHTLFDLFLLTVEPDTLEVRISHRLRETEYETYDTSQLRLAAGHRPSSAALEYHWRQFLQQERDRAES